MENHNGGNMSCRKASVMLGRVWCSEGISDGGMHIYTHFHVFICLVIYLCPQIKLEMFLDVCVHVAYLIKMLKGSLPPVKLELLVNVVLQALTHTALLVC